MNLRRLIFPLGILCISCGLANLAAIAACLFSSVGRIQVTTTDDVVRHAPEWQVQSLHWPSEPLEGWPSCPTIAFRTRGAGLRWAAFSTMAGGVGYEATVVEAGFPLACLRGEQCTVDGGPPVATPPWIDVSARFGELLSLAPHGAVQPRVVPFGLKYGGQLANTAFFAMLLISVRSLTTYHRRTRRRRRGLCLKCGYQLTSTQSQCPECGAVTNSPSSAPSAPLR